MVLKEKPRIALIRRVSPSRANALLNCALSEAFRSAQSVPRLPTHPRGHFGTLAHELLARAGRGAISPDSEAAVGAEWKRLVAEYEKKLGSDPVESSVLPLTRNCADFEVDSILICKAAQKAIPRDKPPGESFGTQAETDFTCRDGLISGRLDRLRRKDGRKVITDLKTGQSGETDNTVREAILVQLKLYAYLVHEITNEWPEIETQSTTGSIEPIHYEPAAVEALASAVKEKLQIANGLIVAVLAGESEESSLASPGSSVCRFCCFRLSCGAFWSAKLSWNDETEIPDLEGRLTSVTPQGSDFLFLELETKDGPAAVRAFRRTMLRGNKVMETGSKIRICELWRDRAPRTYSCRAITVLLVL